MQKKKKKLNINRAIQNEFYKTIGVINNFNYLTLILNHIHDRKA